MPPITSTAAKNFQMTNYDAALDLAPPLHAVDTDRTPAAGVSPATEAALLARIDRLEQDAARLRQDAEASNQRQNEFLAMLAHELRNPLAPIGMAGALLARAPHVSPQMLQMTAVVKRQVEHMSHLLDHLLDAARISGGKITLAPTAVVLADVLAQAVETVAPRLKERQQTLNLDLPQAPVVLQADAVRLTQVFTNLLANASKYTGDGDALSLAVTVAGNAVSVAVADHGCGIGADVLPHIFDLFTQGPRSLARSEGGLGVGLNVVHKLVTMHGGRVDAHSDGVGCGAVFTVTLPLAPALTTPLPHRAAPPATRAGAPYTVLLIDDNLDACATLSCLLTMDGHSVATAHDGKAGLAMALAGRFDIVICDIGLPELDGYEVVGGLRRDSPGAGPYAIALSGYCQARDRAQALDAGFDHYLVKPIQADTLLALIGSGQCQRRCVPAS